LWETLPDPNFIAPPKKGSPHSRGVAIDLTLIKNGKQLDMGTEFDEFSKLSHHGNLDISKTAYQNRLILLGIMTDSGWDFYRNEWWHYQLFNSKDYQIVDNIE
jgi:D-alanyl-D-alanine dipeptidase